MAVVARNTKSGTVYWVATSVAGRKHWERSGTDKRAAERLDRQRKREVKTGTFIPGAPTGRISVSAYSERWLKKRETRSANEPREVWHCCQREWLARLPLADLEPRHCEQLIRELQAHSGLSGKTISNVWGTFRNMVKSAHIEGVISHDPCVIRRGLLSRSPSREHEIYQGSEIRSLLSCEDVPADVRVLIAMMAYTGMRLGEACGRRWRDLDPGADPLWCLEVSSQYGDQPLKTDRPRRVPVHADLRAILEQWWAEGWELYNCRPPALEDWMVPRRHAKASTSHHTKTSARAQFQRACELSDVEDKTVHSLRRTMITNARRNGAPKDVLERVTHNARGDIVDSYTLWEWQPLCDVVSCVDYSVDSSVDRKRKTMKNLAENDGEMGSPSRTRRVSGAEISRDNVQSTALASARNNRKSLRVAHAVDASQLRVNRLRMLEQVDPEAARPGLAVCRGLELALAGDTDGAVALLRDVSDAR